jgi:nitrate/TMAO reductase-like tetraheme cytochrome c subunit
MRRSMKLGFAAIMVAVLIWAFGGSAMAFHESTGLVCNLCHTMHYSQDGGVPTNGSNGPNPYLLLKDNKTDLCLICHATNASGENYLVTATNELAPAVFDAPQDSPGGDYDNVNAVGGALGGSMTKGHNPYGYPSSGGPVIEPDTTLADTGVPVPPGADGEEMWEWSCLSCHRPHKDTGLADSDVRATYDYRLLRKHLKGPHATPGTYTDVSTALDDAGMLTATLTTAPAGLANVDAETATNHNVYYVSVTGGTKGLGLWCGGCHSNPDSTGDPGTGFHGGAKSDSDVGDVTETYWIRHPTATVLPDPATGSINDNYGNTYIPTLPLETADGTAGTGANWDTTDSADEQVFCMSCHRAHATEYGDAVRWDSNAANPGVGCQKCHNIGAP